MTHIELEWISEVSNLGLPYPTSPPRKTPETPNLYISEDLEGSLDLFLDLKQLNKVLPGIRNQFPLTQISKITRILVS